jgi:alpha-1,2-mannosyltransferase
VSERRWKHHFVTLLVPYTYLMARFLNRKLRFYPTRVTLSAAMWLSVFLMATTSDAIGGVAAHGQGHKYAQAYGMFFVAALVLYMATAWQVTVARREAGEEVAADVPAPHFAAAARTAAVPR